MPQWLSHLHVRSCVLRSVMQTLLVVATNVGLVLILLPRPAVAQPERGSMMGGSMPMLGGSMMVVVGLFWVLLIVIMVLTILLLIKQLRK